ncbi:MAG TPA: methylmalonyl-CoA mutase family protein, partial [Leptospiraceae bacterium]|nr:methylmalonyl-CoA mutase family protein [Leptospiraceae bacterium]
MYELKNIALNIAGEADSPPEKAVRLHDFVRDRIRFGLTHKLDFAGAEETMELGYGTSSTKGLLLMKLLSEADINSQMHFVTVKKDFYRHCFPDVVYSLMPETVTHCYLEINVDGTYIPTDSYSVERKLFLEARKVLEGIGEKCGFGFTYVERAIERGIDVDAFAPRLSFFFNAHIDFFEEIAKYRAARRIWARELKETYGAKKPESMRLRF